jgi:hypothetical protein
MKNVKTFEEFINESNNIVKNTAKHIIQILKKQLPNITDKKINKEVELWLDEEKNLITAINSSGQDYQRDVIDVLMNKFNNF